MSNKTITRPFELKSIDDSGVFTGYGAVFNELDSYRDIILPGAFVKTLQADFAAKQRKVPMLYQHDSRQPIGVYDEVKEDAYGLWVQGAINMEVERGRETRSLMQQGALTGLSIGYNSTRDEWDEKQLQRKLFEVNLWEISPVTFPAGDNARVSQIKSISQIETLSELEDYLRDARDFSKNEATAFVARVKAVALGDPVDAQAAKIKRALEHLTKTN